MPLAAVRVGDGTPIPATTDRRRSRQPVCAETDTHSTIATERSSVTDPNDALAADPHLGPLVDRYGPVRIEPADDIFERFVTSIVRQQISMTAADAIRDRLHDRIEVTPTGIRHTDPATLREVGLSERKATYLVNVAEAFERNGYDRSTFDGMADEAIVAELTGITGVGRWTAKMFLLFCLGRPDVFPVEDLGIRNAMRELHGDIDRSEMEDRAEAWRPYRSYASEYLWRAVD